MKKRTKIFLKLFAWGAVFVILFIWWGDFVSKAPDYTKGDNAEFVKSVAHAITVRLDSPDQLHGESNSIFYDLEKKPVFQPYLAMLDFEAKQDAKDPSLVHYSCKINNAALMCMNIGYNAALYGIFDADGTWVSVKGDVRVMTDEKGNRRIDLEANDSVFTAYAYLRYTSPALFEARSVDISKGINSKNYSDAMPILTVIGANGYAAMLDKDSSEYLNKAVIPHVKSLNATLNSILGYKHNCGYGVVNMFYHADLTTKIICTLVAVLVLFFIVKLLKAIAKRTPWGVRWTALHNPDADKRREAVKKLDIYFASKTIRKVALNDDDKYVVDAAACKLRYVHETECIHKVLKRSILMPSTVNTLIGKLRYPYERKALIEHLNNSEPNSASFNTALRALPIKKEREVYREMALKGSTVAIDKLTLEDDMDTLDKLVQNGNEYVINKFPELQGREGYENIALKSNNWVERKNALEKLSYPESRDVIVQVALNDSDEDVRKAALGMLSYSKESETLVEAALSDENADIRWEALKKLPYSKERKSLVKAALEDENDNNRLTALQKLPYPKERATLRKAAVSDLSTRNRKVILEKLTYPKDKETLITCAVKDEDEDNRLYALKKLPFPEEKEAYLKAALDTTKSGKYAEKKFSYIEEPKLFADKWIKSKESYYINNTLTFKAAVGLYIAPEYSDELAKELCVNIQKGVYPDMFHIDSSDRKEWLSIAGWSAAALGRILAKKMNPSDIDNNFKRLEPAIDRHNKLAERIKELRETLMSPLSSNSEKQNTSLLLEGVFEEYRSGLGYFMIENKDLPFAYLVHLMKDNQSRIPRFIKQGVIMGLLDWLLEHKSEPQAKQLLETVISVRAELIRADNKMSFFEVRVPKGSTPKEYASVLKMVLHIANPSLPYCDTNELLNIAIEEVPGVMDMLNACPLRLIDPVNQQTLGFYEFEPYVHMMWVQYQPPKDVGKVTARYHEVDDRTLPLSSGLNLRLFCDPYSVIPTLYHEHEHFAGDPNEASVFLKTQFFSIAFYKKYREANATQDAVFAQMTDMLGMPPQVGKNQKLNDTIEKYYGKQISEDEAVRSADDQIGRLNNIITITNLQEKWCPSVKFPRFTEDEDKENMQLMREIIIRYSTVPRSITREEFNKIQQQFQ